MADDSELLFAALQVLRDAPEALDPSLDRQWRIVQRWLEARARWNRGDRGEVVQAAMLSIARAVRSMEADNPFSAAKWVSTILHRKHLDEVRRLAAEQERFETSERMGLDHVEDTSPRTLAPDALARIVELVEGEISSWLERTIARPSVRDLRRQQARAALHRLLLEADSNDLKDALGLGPEDSADRVYKWVERGRAVVIDGLAQWQAREGPESVAAAIASVVRDIMESRRSDSGRARTKGTP